MPFVCLKEGTNEIVKEAMERKLPASVKTPGDRKAFKTNQTLRVKTAKYLMGGVYRSLETHAYPPMKLGAKGTTMDTVQKKQVAEYKEEDMEETIVETVKVAVSYAKNQEALVNEYIYWKLRSDLIKATVFDKDMVKAKDIHGLLTTGGLVSKRDLFDTPYKAKCIDNFYEVAMKEPHRFGYFLGDTSSELKESPPLRKRTKLNDDKKEDVVDAVDVDVDVDDNDDDSLSSASPPPPKNGKKDHAHHKMSDDDDDDSDS